MQSTYYFHIRNFRQYEEVLIFCSSLLRLSVFICCVTLPLPLFSVTQLVQKFHTFMESEGTSLAFSWTTILVIDVKS
jgi:hypothetical protein